MGALYGTSLNASDSALRRLSDDTQILAQGVLLIILTEPGESWSSPESGFGLLSLVGRSFEPAELLGEAARASAAVEYDPRIASCSATLTTTFTALGQAALTIALQVTPKDASLAPFLLTTTAGAAAVTTTITGLGS